MRMAGGSMNSIIEENGLSFMLHHSTREATILRYRLSSDILNIPEYVSGYKVTAIADNAFELNEGLHVVVLPSTLEHIGMYAFCGSSVEEVMIKSDGTRLQIGECAFSGCFMLTTIQLPSETFLEGSYVFAYCNNLKNIDSCNIKSNIFAYTFLNCSSLKFFQICQNNMRIAHTAFHGVTLGMLSVHANFQFEPDFLDSIQDADIVCYNTSCLSDLAYDGFQIRHK